MTRSARLVRVLLLAGSTFSALAPVALSQTAEQPPVRVDSNLVVVRAAVQDTKIMGRAPTNAEELCWLKEWESFVQLRPMDKSSVEPKRT